MSSFEHEKVIRDTPKISWVLVTVGILSWTLTYVKPEYSVYFRPVSV